MRIAVAADGEMVSRQFSETRWFLLCEAEEGRVTRELTVPSLGEDQEALVRALSDCRVSVLICGALSGSARAALIEAGILTFGGVIGKTHAAVDALMNGSLAADPSVSRTGEGCSGSCSEENCKDCQFKSIV